MVQWIPSHIEVLGKEIADGLANEGRSMPQPRKPLSVGPHWRQQFTCPTIRVLKYSLSLMRAHTKSATCRSVGAILCVLQPGLTSVTLLDARSVLQHGTAKLWGASRLSRDERFPRFYESCKARDYLQCIPRSDAVQIVRARAKHRLLLADRARHGWLRLLPVVFAGNEKKRLSMSCPSAGKRSVTAPVDGPPSP
ncbi:hypothetical protein PoB_005585200 [Plakobranchus ocellatus]|uniref:RNase H type-1 domain-containing protein n=1 Tax=Plakobranchus ocellatus TaxID=259542 RepID=A0AAV4CDE2_9GAST|nr:hypothetical protein PoB_005585200 [Plakobranchus ocellatus]